MSVLAQPRRQQAEAALLAAKVAFDDETDPEYIFYHKIGKANPSAGRRNEKKRPWTLLAATSTYYSSSHTLEWLKVVYMAVIAVIAATPVLFSTVCNFSLAPIPPVPFSLCFIWLPK
jgi:hypothetical protein